MRTRLLFAGYYGMQNTGDDAFCVVSAWGAARYWHANSINFLSKQLPVLTVQAKAALEHKWMPGGYLPSEATVAIMRRQTIVFSGGSLFHSRTKDSTRMRALKLADTLGLCTVGAIGVSIGPFNSVEAEREIQALLRRFSFLAVRDRESYEIASAMNLSCVPVEARDLAFLLPKALGCPQEALHSQSLARGQKIIGIALCHYERYVGGRIDVERAREDRLLEAIRTLCGRDKNLRFRFFILNGNDRYGDSDITNEFIARLPSDIDKEIVPYNDDIGQTLRRIRECQAVVSIRLHGAILAAVANVPFLLIEYHRKCSDFLNDISWPSTLRIGDADTLPASLADKAEEALEYNHAFPCGLSSVQRMAERNFTCIQEDAV